MEISFSKLKKLDVICLADGKNAGRFFDVVFTMPDGRIKGFFATGCKGFKLGKQEVFIPLGDIAKIGEDAVLVKNCGQPPDKTPAAKRRDDCKRQPPAPCSPREDTFGQGGNRCAPPFPEPESSRRSYDDYE